MTCVSATRPNVLLVLRDRNLSWVFRADIESGGFRVSCAKSGGSAKTMLLARPYDVMIAGTDLGDLDGLQLIQWVKQQSPLTEVIVYVAEATIDTATRALRAGACDYLTGPNRDLLLESVRRASAIHGKRKAEHHDRDALERERTRMLCLLNQLTLGVMLIDADCTILLENLSARSVLDDGTVLRRDSLGRLSPAPGDQAAEFMAALCHCRSSPSGFFGGVVHFERGGGAAPITVFLAPSPDGSVPSGSAVITVFISDPERAGSGLGALLGHLYGLSRAESLVAAKLAQGRSVEQSAKDLAISVHTARTHLKHIFAKTGASRQSELAHLLSAGAALVRSKQNGERDKLHA